MLRLDFGTPEKVETTCGYAIQKVSNLLTLITQHRRIKRRVLVAAIYWMRRERRVLVAAIYWMRGEISRAPGYKICHTTKVAAKVDILSHFVGKYDANGRN